MDEETQRWLLSNVDANGNPKWEPATLDDLSEEEIEGLPEGDYAIEYEEVYEGDQFLLEDTWHIDPTVELDDEEEVDIRARIEVLAIALGIFFLVLLPRLYVLFFVTDPQNPGLGWYGDTFHHWQVAYLSSEIGFSHGFLRLWDFKGMEYFWGLLHPLVLVGLFKLTGSVDIVIPRLVSAVGASISISMLFFLLRRYFNLRVALAGVLLAAFNPVGVFSDSIGMQEPLGLIMLLGGLLLWPRNAGLTGVMWALAGTVRAEYWVFGAGLVAVAILSREELQRKILIGLGWAVPSLVYMKYLLDKTGNPIYPVYWNFLGNAAGEWMEEGVLTPDRLIAQWTARIVLLVAIVAAVRVLQARPKYYLFLLLGLGNIIFLSLMWGFSAYIHGFIPRFLYDRLLVVPYMYLGIFLAIGLLNILPRRMEGEIWPRVGWGAILGILALSQLVWRPLVGYYEPLRSVYAREVQLADDIATYYKSGTLVIPEDRPGLTYALVRYHGIEAEDLLGQKYDPFAYFNVEDPFAVWDESRLEVARWFNKHDVRLLAFYDDKENYLEMVRREPWWFQQLATVGQGKIKVYEVLVE